MKSLVTTFNLHGVQVSIYISESTHLYGFTTEFSAEVSENPWFETFGEVCEAALEEIESAAADFEE